MIDIKSKTQVIYPKKHIYESLRKQGYIHGASSFIHDNGLMGGMDEIEITEWMSRYFPRGRAHMIFRKIQMSVAS